MASYFSLSSVKEFAQHIANATSEERQRMLRDFYASQYPEVKDFFVDSAAGLVQPAHEAGKRGRNKSEKKESSIREKVPDSKTLSFKDSTKRNSQIGSTKRYTEKSVKPQSHGFCREELFSSNAETPESPVSSAQGTGGEKHSQVSRGPPAPSALGHESEACEGRLGKTVKVQQDLARMRISRNEALFRMENKKIKTPVLEEIAVVGLLGDTSILDDLFKSHGNSPTRLPRKILSGPLEKAKQRPKDFWDILNEQNDDSLSKLTDLALIETLCEKVPLAAPSRTGERETSLWKSNENFLWRKVSSRDTDENTTKTQE